MKLSSINRFKNRFIEVVFLTHNKEQDVEKGVIDDVTNERITLISNTKLVNIPIDQIVSIEELPNPYNK